MVKRRMLQVNLFQWLFSRYSSLQQMANLELTMYPDSASWSTVDCRGGWLRFAILCSITISVTLYVRTFVKGLGRWTTSPTAFSSKHQT